MYIISAVNISNNPDINLLVIGIVMSTLFLTKCVFFADANNIQDLEMCTRGTRVGMLF